MINTVMLLIVLSLSILIILMVLPNELSSKTATSIMAIATMITAFEIFRAANEYSSKLLKEAISLNDTTFIEIQKHFLEKDSLNNYYNDIYGNQFSKDEHAVTTMMAQRMEDVNNLFKLSDMSDKDLQNSSLEIFIQWVNSSKFKKIWPNIKKYYDVSLDKLISRLQNLKKLNN